MICCGTSRRMRLPGARESAELRKDRVAVYLISTQTFSEFDAEGQALHAYFSLAYVSYYPQSRLLHKNFSTGALRMRRGRNSVREPAMIARFKTAALPNEKCESIGWHLCTLCSGWLSIVLRMRLGKPIGGETASDLHIFWSVHDMYYGTPRLYEAISKGIKQYKQTLA